MKCTDYGQDHEWTAWQDDYSKGWAERGYPLKYRWCGICGMQEQKDPYKTEDQSGEGQTSDGTQNQTGDGQATEGQTGDGQTDGPHAGKTLVKKTIRHWMCGCHQAFDSREEWGEHAQKIVDEGGPLHGFVIWDEEIEIWE